ncbi:MAG: hypothetical protein ACI841_004590 [Planctomycetota bacterium]|jgi:hypothetical protein
MLHSTPDSRFLARPRLLCAVLTLATTLALTGCPASTESTPAGPFTVFSTLQAVAIGTPIVFSGDHFAFLAAESSGSEGGEDRNGDFDTADSVVVVQNYETRTETVVGVAARELAWVGDDLFMVVREDEDDRDWDDDTEKGEDEYSLLYWSPEMTEAIFVASLSADAKTRILPIAGERLLIVEEGGPASGQGTTTLSTIEAGTPELPLPVITSSDAVDGLNPQVLGIDEGLVILLLNEATDGDLNEDTDDTDAVLALLDGTQAAGVLHSTGKVIEDSNVPVRAKSTGDGDWLVTFLVDEEGSQESLNDRDLFPAIWDPEGCPSATDTDEDDQVLAFLHFADWVADSSLSPVRNTGFAGRERVFIAGVNVGTIVHEEDDGGCNLNGDADATDRIVRWVFAEPDAGIDLAPVGTTNLMLALADTSVLAGSTLGVAELGDRIVILVGEENDNRSHDESVEDVFDLIGWIDPDDSIAWEFNHSASSSFFLGATWIEETPGREHLLIAALEEVSGSNFNIPAGATGPDMDTRDSVPVILSFEGNRLFPGLVPVAARATNAGLTLFGDNVYGRLHEAADSRDLNGDGDQADDLVFRHNLTSGGTTVMSVLNNIGGRRAIDADDNLTDPVGCAFIADERDESADFNRDGDEEDFVIRYFLTE